MRIESMKKVEQVYQNTSVKQSVQSVSKSQKDNLQISDLGKDLVIAKKAVSETEDVRYDKINEIKRQMQSGTYNVSCEEIAQKMVDSYFDTSI